MVRTAEAAGESGGGESRPDADIEAAVLEGQHRDALALCARRWGTSIGRLCMAMVGSQADADELTQESLLEAHASFDAYRGEGSLKAWVFTIARRKCARHLEKRGRRDARLRLVHDADAAAVTEDLMVARERAELARRALDKVRPSEREALLLRYVGELSFHDVGEVCGINEAAARKRVSRALCRLRTALPAED